MSVKQNNSLGLLRFARNDTISTFLILFLFFATKVYAQDSPKPPFQGEIIISGANIRSDSTITSGIIYAAQSGEIVDVTSELYDWYKIRLPKTAPAYIKKELIENIPDPQGPAGKATKDNVNIRLKADISSAVLGKAGKNELVKILGEETGWYKIEPTRNCLGWIHKKNIRAAEKKAGPIIAETQKITTETTKETNNKQVTSAVQRVTNDELSKEIIIIGIINSYGKVFWRKATHKLIAADNKKYLLIGDKKSLNALLNRKVKIHGKNLTPPEALLPLIEILKVEVLD